MAGGTGKMFKNLDFQGNGITGLADASTDNGAATWGQVQALVRGLSWKDAVRAATTANITLSGTQTIDGVALVVGDEVLVKNQASATENGIYVVAAGAWARRSDAAIGSDARSLSVAVMSGTANGDKQFVQTNEPAVVGTDALAFALLGGSGGTTYIAGNGLTETPAGTFNVGAGTGISVGADSVGIDPSVVARKFTNSATHSAGATLSLNHNLGHRDYVVSVCIDGTGEEVTAGVDITKNLNDVSVAFSSSQGANTIRITVVG